MLDFKPFQTVKISTVISYKYLKSLFFYSYFPIPPQQTHEADMYLRRNPDQTREEAFSTQDFLSDLEAKYHAEDYYFEQELMDLFRPSVEHNQAWGAMLFLELFFYSGMPESYTKSVHNMVLAKEEAECNSAQANT